MRNLGGKLSFANVTSLLALFVALATGGAYAADELLEKNDVRSKHLKNAAVKTKDIADNAVTSPKIRDGSLLGEDFAAGQLPAGPPGPQGERGLPGAPGEPGATDVVVRWGARKAPSASENAGVRITVPFDLTAPCLQGERAVGGGIETAGTARVEFVTKDQPAPVGTSDDRVTPTGWRIAGAFSHEGADWGSGVWPIVVCASP